MVLCPKCGFDIPSRAKLGEGTTRGRNLKKLNENKKAILEILTQKEWMVVREVQKRLFNAKIKRISRKGVVAWNYHNVQAELSILVGAGYVEMSKSSESFDESSGEYVASPVPKYHLTLKGWAKVGE